MGDGEALAVEIGLGGCWGIRMQLGGHREGLGRSFLGWGIDGRCVLGLGMWLGIGVLTIGLGDVEG